MLCVLRLVLSQRKKKDKLNYMTYRHIRYTISTFQSMYKAEKESVQ